jgi:hypothetical protein
MNPTFARVIVVTTLMTVGASSGLAAQDASAVHDDGKFVYAVTVICGFGTTSINVHNPNGRTITFTKKGIPLDPGQVPTPPNEKQQESLKADWAFLVGCDDIAALGAMGSSGLGDVIIESKLELDVWAVYTGFVAGGGVGETRVVRVPATRIKK